MAKETKVDRDGKEVKGPKFGQNTTIYGRALVTDKNGEAWWVDPEARLMTKAEPR